MRNTTTWIDRLRNGITDFLDAYEELQGLGVQYVYLSYGTALVEADVHPADMQINDDITLQQVKDAVATLSALKTALDNGHGEKLYRLRR